MTTNLHRHTPGDATSANGTRPTAPHAGGTAAGGVAAGHVLRWWPLMLLTTLAAVAASLVMVWGPRTPSYSATTKMPVTPLSQSDETFLGTSLVRDAGDADRTSSTVARLLDSHQVAVETARSLGGGWTPESVRGAVDVTPVGETNMIEITARAPEPAQAVRLAQTFAETALKERWQTISAELDRRIAFATRNTDVDPNAGEESRRLQLLTFVRENGVDPTLSIDSTSPPVRVEEMSEVVVIGMAAVGGLFVGVVAAYGIERFRRRPRDDEAAVGESELPMSSPTLRS
ncbi:hypothetical protein ACFY7C_04050 [Streptomyces sp. NPDC012769]|uniref:hypothetical protein n=1 Tax=Streptomyces sp. NPDC012769 TaxID=3364848 RepID=UPI0036C7BF3C